MDVTRNGKRSRGTCKPLARGERTRKPCRYWKRARGLTADGVAGVNRIALGSTFKPGAYRAVVGATDAAGNASSPATVGFRVAR